MDTCAKGYRPSFFDLVIQTSDVTLYDGPNLSCIPVAPGASLNQIIASIDSILCSAISTPTNVSAANVIYSGQTGFGCFGLNSPYDMNSVVEQLAGQICTVQNSLTELTINDLNIVDFNASCAGNFPGSVAFTTVLSAIVAELCTTSTAVGTIGSSYVNGGDLSAATLDGAYVVSGGTISSGGLSATMDPGVYFADGRKRTKGTTGNITLTATADNYIDYDSASTNYIVSPVAVGDPAPALAADRVRLWRLRTDAVSVTSSTDLRVYGWVGTTALLDSAVSTAKLANLAVTGAKMEDIGAAGTFGDAAFVKITYDTKGRVTSHVFNIDLTGLAAGNILQYTGSQWVPAAVSSIGGTGTAGRLARFTGASTLANSGFRDDGSTQGLNAAVSATIQFNVATTLQYGQYVTNSGSNATQYGYYSAVSGASSTDVGGFFQANGSLSGITGVGAHVGVVATAATLNARNAYGLRAGVTGDPASSGACVAIYANVINGGSGASIGLLVENGQGIFGGTSPAAAALFQLDSTTQGFLPPRMTTGQRDAIASPVAGLTIFNVTTGKLNVFTSTWEAVTSA